MPLTIRTSTWSPRGEENLPSTRTETEHPIRTSGAADLDRIASSGDKVRVGDYLDRSCHAGPSSADRARPAGHGRGRPQADRGDDAGRGARADGGDGAGAQGGASSRRPG